ncbi:MAG: lamin tail domain-containing protein [Myxococcota bacterium]
MCPRRRRRRRHRGPASWLGLALSITVSCAPPLPSGAAPGASSTAATTPNADASFEVRPDPDSDLSVVSRIARLRVIAEASATPETFVLIAGEVGSAHLGQLARDDVSKALRARIVETLRYRTEGLIVLAPTAALAPGRYAVARGQPKGAIAFDVVPDADGHHPEAPTLSFVFPPGGRHGPAAAFGVWCGAPPDVTSGVLGEGSLTLEPSGPSVRARRGITTEGDGPGCIRFDAEEPSSGPQLPPVGVDVGPTTWWLEPHLLVPAAPDDDPPDAPETCPPAAVTVGPGCVAVADDRVWLWPGSSSYLWSVLADGDSLEAPLAPPSWVDARARFTLVGLSPNHRHDLRVTWVDHSGADESRLLSVITAPPRAHVVITEVMANPVGLEPEQEWVELYNDGSVAADLGDYRLEDPAGGTDLPSVALPPGRHALVVVEDYDRQSYYDASPPDDAIVVRVAALGTHGLANGGEPLALVELDENRVVSRFPAVPKPKSGHSVARRHPHVDVTDPDGFHRTDVPTPGAENADAP